MEDAAKIKLDAEKGAIDGVLIVGGLVTIIYYVLALFRGWEKNPVKVLPSCMGVGAGIVALIVYNDDPSSHYTSESEW